ncbi:hypothetical protein AB0E67_00075 [Streptomyces sp. NPDC032161]|uniref:hypothetical protein n=1 Tax=unclassified Streptomyces TaxID=2593676 RepID=UPI0033DD77A0
MSGPSADKPRSRRPLYAVTAALLAVALAGGAWFLLGRGQPTDDCGTLIKDDRVRSALGSHYSAGMSCTDLGAAVKAATTGGKAAPHTRAQADSMKKILLAVNDSLIHGDGALAAELRLPLAESLADYANDTQEILDGTNSEYTRWASPNSIAWQDATGYHFSVFNGFLVRVLRAVSEEPAAYAALRDAQTRWGAAQLGSLTAEARKNDLGGAPVTNAAALGGYDAIAADVVRSKEASDAPRWVDAVYAALRSPEAPVSAAPRSALSDPIAKSWRASLASVPAEERTDHLREQGAFMFTAWAEAAGVGRDRAEPVEEQCRRTGQERYGAIAQDLRRS